MLRYMLQSMREQHLLAPSRAAHLLKHDLRVFRVFADLLSSHNVSMPDGISKSGLITCIPIEQNGHREAFKCNYATGL